MIKPRSAFIFFLIICCHASCSQTNQVVKKSIAYKSIRNMGTIAVDDNGNQISKSTDTLLVIYAETSNEEVNWEKAAYNGRIYSIASTIAEERPVVIGLDKQSGQKLYLNPSEGSKVWKLELISSDQATEDKLPSGTIIITGNIREKKFSYTVKKLTEISQPDSY